MGQANCGEAAELLWKTDKTDKGLKITNKTKRQMDAMGASGYGYVKQNTPRQIWAIDSVNNGKHVTFRNVSTKKCLEAVEAKNNGHYKIVTCDAYSEDQWFSLEAPKKLALPEGWFNIVGHSGLCVAARLQNGNLSQQNCGDRDNLLWKAEEYKNGYVILNKTGRVMYNSGNSMLGYTRNNSWQTIWSIESVMHGKYITFRNIYRKTYCLDDTGKHKKNLLYRTFACSNENKNQWFLLETPKKTQRLYPEGYFNIIGKSGLCVSSKINNSNLQQEKCGELDTLLWTVKRNGDGLYIINKTTRAMDASGATVRGYAKSKTTRQIWAIESVNNGKYVHIRNFVQNKCLDNKGKSGINNLYRVWICDLKNQDQWFLLDAPKKTQQLYPNGYFNIVGRTGLCVAARNNNSYLVQVNCGDVQDLMWTVEKRADGLIIKNKTKRQMDAMGAQVYGYVRQVTPRQRWAIESVNDGKHVTFRNYIQNKCVDDNGKPDNNQHYRMWKCDNENKGQWFTFAEPKKLALPEGWFNIVGYHGLCVAARLQNGNLTHQNCTSRDSLLWKAEEYKNGYVIQNKTKRVMYNSGNSMLGYTRNNSWQTIWSIESVMHGKYITFRNIYRKTYCLDDTGKHKKNLLYRTFACSNENKNQWFLLETPKKTQRLYPEGYFNIIGKSGLCVSSRINNSNLQQERCGELDTLLWTVKRNG